MAFSFWDLGGCGCGVPCVLCNMPASALAISLSLTLTPPGTHYSGSGSLAYLGGSPQTWQNTSIPLGGGYHASVTVQCSATCFYMQVLQTINNLGGVYNNPSNCLGDTHTFFLTAHSCSPLSFSFNLNFGINVSGTATLT